MFRHICGHNYQKVPMYPILIMHKMCIALQRTLWVNSLHCTQLRGLCTVQQNIASFAQPRVVLDQ